MESNKGFFPGSPTFTNIYINHSCAFGHDPYILMGSLGWWKKLEEYSYYFHIWVFVINPTVRVHIYPLYVVGGNSKIFSIFSPRMFGEDFVPFWWAGIFFEWVGWNHQLVIQWPPCCNGKCGQVGWCHLNLVFVFVILLDLFVSEEFHPQVLVGNLIKDWLATELQVYNKPCWDLNQYFSFF